MPPPSGLSISRLPLTAEGEVVELVERWGVSSAVFYPTGRDAEGPMRRRWVGFHFLDISDETAVTPIAAVVVDLTAGEVESVNFHATEG